jgi:hypothetical protein
MGWMMKQPADLEFDVDVAPGEGAAAGFGEFGRDGLPSAPGLLQCPEERIVVPLFDHHAHLLLAPGQSAPSSTCQTERPGPRFDTAAGEAIVI